MATFLAVIGPHPTCRNLQKFLKFQSHSYLKIMINTDEPVHSFTIKDNDKDSSSIWIFLTHPETYMGIIGLIFTVCIGVYCFKIFWMRPATPRHWAYSPVSLQYAIVDDDVEVAPIYRCRGMAEEPRRSCKNHDLHIEQEATRLESCYKQPVFGKSSVYTRSLASKAKIQGMQ